MSLTLKLETPTGLLASESGFLIKPKAHGGSVALEQLGCHSCGLRAVSSYIQNVVLLWK